jgi:hypothetical protein
MQKSVTKKIEIAVGSVNNTLDFKLENGKITNVVAISNGAENADNCALSLALRDADGVDIISQMNVKLWGMRQGASFKDSMIPLDLDTKGRSYKLFFTSNRVWPYDGAELEKFIFENKIQTNEVEVTFFYE